MIAPINSGKVSIIVPVYKVETELDRCVQSLLYQTYKNIEIILVDDGSPDNCPQMCDNYQVQDIRIKVIHKLNGGLSSARNRGLDIADGKYISFVDSDDWVTEDFIETLVTNIEKENADISIVGYTMIWDNGRIKRFSDDNEYYVFNQEEAIKELLIQDKFQCMVWQKLYKSTLFKSIRFPEGKLYEDVAISIPTFQQCRIVVCSGMSKYFYYQRIGSIVNSNFNVDKLFFLECCNKILQFSDSFSGLYDKEAHVFYLKALMMLLLQVYQLKYSEEKNKICSYLTKEIVLNKKYIWNNSYLKLRKKIVLTLMAIRFPKSILLKFWMKRVGS